MLIRDLTDGQAVDQVLLVVEAELRTRRGGGSFLKLALGDRTGRVAAMLWDGFEPLAEHLVPGRPVHVRGRFRMHPKFGAQLEGCSFGAAADGTYDPADLADGPPRPAEAMEEDLRALVATVRNPHLRELLDRVLGPHTETWHAFRAAPAAKRFHQAYAHGLLEHSLTVAQGVSALSATFPGIDRDVAITGALLHDIGKLEAYGCDDGVIDMTDAGKLEGEIPLGYFRVRRIIEDIPGFPAATAQAVLHIILAHHGSLEHGSPVVPCTREATLVHFIDNLGGRLGSFDRLEKELPAGATWSAFDRGIGGSAFFGPPPAQTFDVDQEIAAAASAAADRSPPSSLRLEDEDGSDGLVPSAGAAVRSQGPALAPAPAGGNGAVAGPGEGEVDTASLAELEPEPLRFELSA